MSRSVSIATKPLVYSAFRYISNKVYNALAEYVDNSIQSFIDHKSVLEKINPKGKLSVWINIDIANDCITIKDNAFGITAQNYDRAFELANIPLDASGLNEFGMGMKVSSIWLSNLWSVETKAYGETETKTLIFDLEEVVKNEKLSLDIQTVPAKPQEHYTIVTLKKLSQNKPSKNISNIKNHLTSIYTKYIREGVLDLYINDELQNLKEPKILNAPYYKKPEESILWKKDITFSFPKFSNGKQVDFYKVSGFIGVLETMSTSTDNGFLLFRRGRVIGSSYDDRYRPKSLCGDEGSPRYKRIFGELELEGFNVSFTKNSFSEDEEFEAFIQLLKEDIANDKTFDIFGQAQNYKKPESPEKKAKRVTTSLISQAGTSVTIHTTPEPGSTEAASPSVPSTSINGDSGEDQKVDNSSANNSSTNELSSVEVTEHPCETSKEVEVVAAPIAGKMSIDGYEFSLSVGCQNGHQSKGLYSLSKVGEEQFESNINLKNQFFERFQKTFASDDNYDSVVNFVRVMAATELMLQHMGNGKAGKSFRDEFNKLIGQF